MNWLAAPAAGVGGHSRVWQGNLGQGNGKETNREREERGRPGRSGNTRARAFGFSGAFACAEPLRAGTARAPKSSCAALCGWRLRRTVFMVSLWSFHRFPLHGHGEGLVEAGVIIWRVN